MLFTTHNAGFFSCCSVRLHDIIQYFNSNKQLPDGVDSSTQFRYYTDASDRDVTFDFFEHYDYSNSTVQYSKDIYIDIYNFQFTNYKTVNYSIILPFVRKYFSPSKEIMYVSNKLRTEYNIETENCIGVYYRGTDKKWETSLGEFDTYYHTLNEIINMNPQLQILIQTDSSQFLNYMKGKLNNIIVIKENSTSYTDRGIHNEKKANENYKDMKNLMATFLIISKCKYVICSSGNCSIWMMYYRENADNVFQYLNNVWF